MDHVKRIIDQWDPVDLLSHAPDDEYDEEIDLIQLLSGKFNDSETLGKGIYDVFVRSFGKETFDKSAEECAIIAERQLSQTVFGGKRLEIYALVLAYRYQIKVLLFVVVYK